MRIIINGQQAFGRACLEAILEKGIDEVVAVYTAPDEADKPYDPIKEAAIEAKLEVRQPNNFKDEDILTELKSWNADFMILAYVTIFVPEQARNIPTLGTVCFHPSLLPLHRGPSSINWPIIWGAKKTGLTIFWPDDGLDEGDILLQQEIEITENDTLGSVYFNKIFPSGIESILRAIELVRRGEAPRKPQNDSLATYESWCKKENAEIDWQRSASEVYNLVRGCNPQPGAWTTFNEEMVQVFDSELVTGTGRIGRVCAVDKESLTINAGLGAIKVKRLRYGKGSKIKAAQFIEEQNIKIGDRFGLKSK
ncbi:formyltransferase family protein [Rhodospirillaceae bacterium]|jgi:methionyl-tRNA formyltransferase|nr:methionyl-tRNA formyltransferase [Rhodospirillaceae bacterium]MBT7731898.1 methionyl-tRNA formyltransferase [Rhodospirillaceae bacterium]MDC1442696.1 formyltransferase family protein [Rhodospirillaceae bacterium]